MEICIHKTHINFIPQHPECREGSPDGDDDRDLSDTDDGSDQPFMVSVSSFLVLDKVFATKHGEVVIKTEYTNKYTM